MCGAVDAIRNDILMAAYIAHISGVSLRDTCTARGIVIHEPHLDIMIRDGLLHDNYTLTTLGRQSIRVVLAGGVFDIIHPGHIHTLESARRLGDVLVVVLATDSTAIRMKRRSPLHSAQQRRTLVGSLRMVDMAMVGSHESIFKTVEAVKPDVVALGYDQVHHEKYISDGCRKINPSIQVARLQSPVPDISSSDIERQYAQSIHGI